MRASGTRRRRERRSDVSAGRSARGSASVAAVATLLILAACGSGPAEYTPDEARDYLEARGFAVAPQELVRAVREDALDVLVAGIAAGIDPDAMDGRAVALAAAAGSTEMLERLLAAGADPNLHTGSFGQTPLVTAVLRNQRGSVELLLAAGADPDAPVRGGTVALHFAKDAETAALLLDRGAQVDVRDGRGGTPLLGAVMLGDLELIELLLEHGADPNAADDHGRTPLLYAEVFQFGAIERLLLQAGAVLPPRPQVGRANLELYSGRYGFGDRPLYQILFDRGSLILIETASNGLLSASNLVPLTSTTFYRARDPGLVLFEVTVEDGRVVGLQRSSGAAWVMVPRLPGDVD